VHQVGYNKLIDIIVHLLVVIKTVKDARYMHYNKNTVSCVVDRDLFNGIHQEITRTNYRSALSVPYPQHLPLVSIG
jgi:hypothetical protein